MTQQNSYTQKDFYKMFTLYNADIVRFTHTDLLAKESAMEKQSMLPPMIQRTEPAQPIKRAAPSSYLKIKNNAAMLLKWVSHI